MHINEDEGKLVLADTERHFLLTSLPFLLLHNYYFAPPQHHHHHHNISIVFPEMGTNKLCVFLFSDTFYWNRNDGGSTSGF